MADCGTGCAGNLHAQASEKREAVHLLPCCINRTGPAHVSHFFNPRDAGATIADGISCQEAAFRGRKLLGTTVALPPHFCGLVLDKEARKDQGGDGVVDSWSTRALFSEFTYWNHDTMPSSADPARRSIDWLRVSQKLHQSVSEQQVASMLQSPTFAAAAKRKV